MHTHTHQHTLKKESVPQHIDFRKCLEFFPSELKIHTIRHSTVRSFICYLFQCPHYLMSTAFDDPPLLGSFDGTNSLVTFPERMPFGKLYEAILIFSQTRQRPLFTVSEHGESRCRDWGMKHQPWVKRPVQPARSLPSLPWLHLYRSFHVIACLISLCCAFSSGIVSCHLLTLFFCDSWCLGFLWPFISTGLGLLLLSTYVCSQGIFWTFTLLAGLFCFSLSLCICLLGI